MDIKYTIEILTKDIQDIEKLVGNIGNSKDASSIEVDLALSKLRNVYEVLTLIKADRIHELISPTIMQETPEPKAKTSAQPEPVPETSEDQGTAGASILAEKFSAEASINENLAEKLGNETEAKLMGQAIDNISRNIGINDRFLIIRELFEGEADRFTSLVNELDNAENFESANSILKQQFADNMDHEGVEILSGLLKRRYIR
jgi:hypothetical protein